MAAAKVAIQTGRGLPADKSASGAQSGSRTLGPIEAEAVPLCALRLDFEISTPGLSKSPPVITSQSLFGPLHVRPRGRLQDETWHRSFSAIRPSSRRRRASDFGAPPTRVLMPVATAPSDSPRPSTLAKMEDRKRPAIGGTDDLAPPSKRVAVNGSKAKDETLEMKEEGWIDVSHTTVCDPFQHLKAFFVHYARASAGRPCRLAHRVGRNLLSDVAG